MCAFANATNASCCERSIVSSHCEMCAKTCRRRPASRPPGSGRRAGCGGAAAAAGGRGPGGGRRRRRGPPPAARTPSHSKPRSLLTAWPGPASTGSGRGSVGFAARFDLLVAGLKGGSARRLGGEWRKCGEEAIMGRGLMQANERRVYINDLNAPRILSDSILNVRKV